MKKYLIFAVVFFLFVFINHSLAVEIPPIKPGKVTPIKWDNTREMIDLVNACPIQDIDPAEPKPTVSNMKGRFKIIRADGSEQYYYNRHGEANAPVELKDGDQIKTSDGSSSINLSDGSSWILGENTTVKYRNNETLTKISLLVGKLRILRPSVFLHGLKKKVAAKLEPKMRVTSACVRGTDFVMEQTEDENTSKYYLHEGTLDIATLQGEIKHLQSGDIAVVDFDGQVVLTKLDDNEWNELVKNLAPLGAINPPAQEGETTTKQSSSKWIVLVTVLLIIGGYYIYKKKFR
ncbi:MAG: hypothetical protein UT05_C0002G0029 [Parcubacteria group bacterium GW2011_GWF2_38_76]|nr:MAG: hypothetical protein UT05_C0002G0029 [Parcubacteria group bacterium GW2011_GWF2_38_76]HBM45813.1 hypothetical protein [Patescibacteria group bacterium]